MILLRDWYRRLGSLRLSYIRPLRYCNFEFHDVSCHSFLAASYFAIFSSKHVFLHRLSNISSFPFLSLKLSQLSMDRALGAFTVLYITGTSLSRIARSSLSYTSTTSFRVRLCYEVTRPDSIISFLNTSVSIDSRSCFL